MHDPYLREADRWLKNEPIEIDIWAGEIGQDDYAQYVCAEKKDIRQKPNRGKCLFVYLFDEKEYHEMLMRKKKKSYWAGR